MVILCPSLAFLGAKVWRKEERKTEVHTEGQCNLPTAAQEGSEEAQAGSVTDPQ